MNIDKLEIIDKLIEYLNEGLNLQNTSFEKARKDSIDAPGAMQSHHDTTKKEKAWLAEHYSKRMVEVGKIIAYFNTIKNNITTDKVKVGNLIKIKYIKSNTIEYYLIVGIGGGITLDYIPLTTISMNAPIAKCIIEKKKGDIVDINLSGNKMEILDIM